MTGPGSGITRPQGLILPKSMTEEVSRRKEVLEKAAKASQQDAVHDPVTQAHWMPEQGKVQREENDRHMGHVAHRMRKLSRKLKPTENCQEVGSLTVHIYHSEALSQMFYVESWVKADPAPRWEDKTFHRICDMAMETLRGYVAEIFAGKRTPRRSGF